jgi:hypothetical protein
VHEWVALGTECTLATRYEAFAVEVELRLSVHLLRSESHLELSWSEGVGQRLHLWSPASHDLALLNLQKSTAGNLSDVLAVSFAILLVLFVDTEQQFLQLVAGQLVLIVKARANAEVKRLFRFLLSRTFLETRTLAS